ncbi:MAG: HEAT repeat domain-containing protein [Gemmatimonadaceae bacterium]
MVDERLLNIVMLIEIALLSLAVSVFFVSGVWRFLNERRLLVLTTAARESLARLVTSGHVNVEQVQALRELSHEVQVIAFLEISRTLTGTGKERLRFIADEVGLVQRARQMCASRRWTIRLRGTRILSRMDVPDPLVMQMLADPHPAVRAQAAEWAAAQPSLPVVSAMLVLLADQATQARFAVQNALLRMGGVVASPLAEFLATHSGRAVEAGLRVAESLAEPSFGPPALKLSRNDNAAIRGGAAKLLGAVGGAEGAARLIELLGDEDSHVRAAAAQSLGRMQHWQAASLLAACLRDPTWRVRRDAGLALRSIGAPGALFLRRALKDDDRFAADMAQQVLDLPTAATG